MGKKEPFLDFLQELIIELFCTWQAIHQEFSPLPTAGLNLIYLCGQEGA
jgi:hypothetical protein